MQADFKFACMLDAAYLEFMALRDASIHTGPDLLKLAQQCKR